MVMVNATEMINKAHEGHYAIGAFNINNLEWTKAILAGVQKANSPVCCRFPKAQPSIWAAIRQLLTW